MSDSILYSSKKILHKISVVVMPLLVSALLIFADLQIHFSQAKISLKIHIYALLQIYHQF
jgi:hypothetical protein